MNSLGLRQLDESNLVVNDIKHSLVEDDLSREESLACIATHLGHPEMYVMMAHGITAYMAREVQTMTCQSVDSSGLSGGSRPLS
jgi:hypothetical protein